MKTIYILLTRSRTCVSRLIGLATADPYTHVSISFEKNLQPMYSCSRRFVHFPLPAGLRVEPLHQGFYKKYNDIPCALYQLGVDDEVYELAKKEVEGMMRERYDFSILGLLLCRLHIPYHRRHHLFCSQFVGDVLSKSNALELPKDTSLMKPIDYTKLPDLNCCFQGSLNELVRIQCPIAG